MTAPTSKGDCDRLATKADVGLVRADLESFRAEFRADMERLRVHIARRLLWLGIAIISAAGVAFGVVAAVVKLA